MTLKNEAMRVIVLPFSLDAMRAELVAFVHWHDAYRPHQSFGGRTPAEVYAGLERVASMARSMGRQSFCSRKSRRKAGCSDAAAVGRPSRRVG